MSDERERERTRTTKRPSRRRSRRRPWSRTSSSRSSRRARNRPKSRPPSRRRETSPEAAVGEVEAPAEEPAAEAPAAEAEAPRRGRSTCCARGSQRRAAACRGSACRGSSRRRKRPPASRARRNLKHVPRSERRKRSEADAREAGERKPIVRLEKPEHEPRSPPGAPRRRRLGRDGQDDRRQGRLRAGAPGYKKVIRRSVKFHAHDEQNEAHVGDRVRIVETRPLSKTKRWRLAEILEVAK